MSGRDPRSDDDLIVVESFLGAAASDHTVAKSGAIVAGTITGDISRIRFEKVWVDQCRATKAQRKCSSKMRRCFRTPATISEHPEK